MLTQRCCVTKHGRIVCASLRWAFFANLGGTAGVALVPDVWDKGLFFCGGNGYVADKTMAKPINELGIKNDIQRKHGYLSDHESLFITKIYRELPAGATRLGMSLRCGIYADKTIYIGG